MTIKEQGSKERQKVDEAITGLVDLKIEQCRSARAIGREALYEKLNDDPPKEVVKARLQILDAFGVIDKSKYALGSYGERELSVESGHSELRKFDHDTADIVNALGQLKREFVLKVYSGDDEVSKLMSDLASRVDKILN